MGRKQELKTESYSLSGVIEIESEKGAGTTLYACVPAHEHFACYDL
jgi:hypothetical protein